MLQTRWARWVFLVSGLGPLVSAIWPAPSQFSSGKITLWIEETVKFHVKPHLTVFSRKEDADGPLSGTDMIDSAITRTKKILFEQSFVPWKFHPRHADFEPSTIQKKKIKSVELRWTGTDSPNVAKGLAGEIDESYRLTISEEGDVFIAANTSIGLVRALTSFSQLFYRHSERAGVYTPLAPVDIRDSPQFGHRGINMDLARHYFPIGDIKRTIDAMAYSKLNRLHLHITDSQSWPLEIPAIPELARKGAYHKGLTYSPADIRSIQNHGALQGVQVYLEIDMPGHTSSIAYSRPELIVNFNKQPEWSRVSAQPPSGTLKLNSSSVYEFLDKVLDDLMPRVSPYGSYFHTGGDEVNLEAYMTDETVKSRDIRVLQPLVQRLVDHTHKKIRAAGLTPIVWEEMLLDWNLSLGKDVLVQAWQAPSTVELITNMGHKVIAGSSSFWYLDCGQGQWLNPKDDDGLSSFPFLDCSPRKNWRVMYSFDPLANLEDNQKSLVVGGEVHIWAEQTDAVNLDRMIWPRAAAAAEVLWSGGRDSNGKNRSQMEAAPRLSDLRERLVAMGVMAEPIQMPFCLMEKNQCNS